MKGNSTIISVSCKIFENHLWKTHLLINRVRGSIEKFSCLFIVESMAIKIVGCPDRIFNIQNFAKLSLLFISI